MFEFQGSLLPVAVAGSCVTEPTFNEGVKLYALACVLKAGIKFDLGVYSRECKEGYIFGT
jgi:hypothetical protein